MKPIATFLQFMRQEDMVDAQVFLRDREITNLTVKALRCQPAPRKPTKAPGVPVAGPMRMAPGVPAAGVPVAAPGVPAACGGPAAGASVAAGAVPGGPVAGAPAAGAYVRLAGPPGPAAHGCDGATPKGLAAHGPAAHACGGEGPKEAPWPRKTWEGAREMVEAARAEGKSNFEISRILQNEVIRRQNLARAKAAASSSGDPAPHSPGVPAPDGPAVPDPHGPAVTAPHGPAVPEAHGPAVPAPHGPADPASHDPAGRCGIMSKCAAAGAPPPPPPPKLSGQAFLGPLPQAPGHMFLGPPPDLTSPQEIPFTKVAGGSLIHAPSLSGGVDTLFVPDNYDPVIHKAATVVATRPPMPYTPAQCPPPPPPRPVPTRRIPRPSAKPPAPSRAYWVTSFRPVPTTRLLGERRVAEILYEYMRCFFSSYNGQIKCFWMI